MSDLHLDRRKNSTSRAADHSCRDTELAEGNKPTTTVDSRTSEIWTSARLPTLQTSTWNFPFLPAIPPPYPTPVILLSLSCLQPGSNKLCLLLQLHVTWWSWSCRSLLYILLVTHDRSPPNKSCVDCVNSSDCGGLWLSFTLMQKTSHCNRIQILLILRHTRKNQDWKGHLQFGRHCREKWKPIVTSLIFHTGN